MVMKFHPRIAPVKAAVFPLVKKDGMPEAAKEIYTALKKRFVTFYDEKGAVGRRYRRQDEAGTPYCITVDGQTLQDETVTIRDRDSLEQWRDEERRIWSRRLRSGSRVESSHLASARWTRLAEREVVLVKGRCRGGWPADPAGLSDWSLACGACAAGEFGVESRAPPPERMVVRTSAVCWSWPSRECTSCSFVAA